MNRHSKLPARFLLVLLGTILIVAGMTSVSLAETATPDYHGSLFDVVEASSGTAYFSIISNCDGRDHHCTVRVTGTPTDAGGNNEENWRDELQECTNDDSSGDGRFDDFATCWDEKAETFTVTWPTINPGDDFEITPHCKRHDDVCAEELRVCFNAAACDENDYERRDWTRVGELWDEAGSCLYDDDDEDVWECIDEALDDWFDDHMGRNDDYDDLEGERENRRGFTLEDYEDDLDDVGDEQPRGRASETVLERYQRQWAARTPTSIYQSMNEVDTRGPSFRLTADEYLTVNFTTFLESTSPYQICNTTIGCVTVTTYSNTFRSYMQNLHIVIQDRSVLRCMDRAGWDVDDDHVIPFDNPDLILCDERIKVANEVCPAKDTGASDDLFAMWDTGLLRGILPDSFAQGLRLQVERARDRTPECLCAAGFAENNFVVTPENTEGPWERSGALRTEDVCD
ncbi:MAG: hypothetical protein F4Y08_06145 [Caldilineaceae bacterium SB0662_bin_9]|uniref:Uncharacterized protein n=1 Tax=Caldilineaceae bacterium SB0662_bin_9 TaxID=2605258 RepID=A0A6B1DRQ4_9CHLR|nr:hypothetical protein [Caldilineaceae bacterium SB0662_bin_9]